jgi:hypothetical protein
MHSGTIVVTGISFFGDLKFSCWRTFWAIDIFISSPVNVGLMVN